MATLVLSYTRPHYGARLLDSYALFIGGSGGGGKKGHIPPPPPPRKKTPGFATVLLTF